MSDAQVTYAANTVMNGDGLATSGDAAYFVLKTPAAAASERHLEGANYSFADGHVKWLRRDKVKDGDSLCNGGANSPDGSNATFCAY